MRTHPMIIVGGILHENPFFVPPDEFLGELRERRPGRTNKSRSGNFYGSGDGIRQPTRSSGLRPHQRSNQRPRPSAIWTGHDPAHILSTLLDVLSGMLRLDFVYARMNDSVNGSPPIEVVRLAQRRNPTAQPQEICDQLDPWLTGEPLERL